VFYNRPDHRQSVTKSTGSTQKKTSTKNLQELFIIGIKYDRNFAVPLHSENFAEARGLFYKMLLFNTA